MVGLVISVAGLLTMIADVASLLFTPGRRT